jgi:transposase
MAPEIRAIYEAGLRNTPWGRDVDLALDSHRSAYGEIEQILQAQRVDPCDAMRGRPSERYRAYVTQRRYAVRAYTEAGLPASRQARVLGVSVSTIRNDIRVLRGRPGPRPMAASHLPKKNPTRGLAGHTPAQVQVLLDSGCSQRNLGKRFSVSRQAVSKFCKRHRLRRF